jgi:hypothetical protein
MQRAVVRAAQHHQIVRIIAATLRAQIQMVNIQIGGVAATRNAAAPSISPEHFAPNRWRRVLCRAPALQSSGRHVRSTTLAGVCVRELADIAHAGVGVHELSGATSQRGIVVRDLSAAMHGAGRQRERVGIARRDSSVGEGAFVGDPRAVEFIGDTRMGAGAVEFVGDARMGEGEFVGDARAGVGAVEFVGDTRMGAGEGEFVDDARVGEGQFVGDARGGAFVDDTLVGARLHEFAGIGCGTVWRIRGDTVPVSDRDVLCVAVTHLEDCRIELDQVAVRVLKAATAVLALGHHDLVTGAAGITRTAQDFARHQQ